VPEHGHHVFRIGLTDPVRARDPQYLSEQEIDDALYLLHNLESIERLEAQAGKIPPVERNAESNVIDFPES
jgi:hypothetical protein